MSAGAASTTVSLETLLKIARASAADEPGDSHEAKNLRARRFFVGLVAHLNDCDSEALADALQYPHLSTLAKRLATIEAGA